MLPQALCVGLIILQLTGSLEAKLHYTVIFPSEIRFPSSELACMNLEGAEDPGTVQLTLQLLNKNIILLEQRFPQDSFFTCAPFQVPAPSTGLEEVATLEVSISILDEKITNTSKVLVTKKRTNFLIQTDKSIYKPGQTVNFRVVSLKENLQPWNEQIPVIELQDPKSNRIGQWLNVNPNQGIADLSLQLTSEPLLGDYTIKMKGTAHTFTVEEYVLPKFEVTLQFPKMVLYSSEHVPIKLCGRYTYGKPVQGEYTCKVCREASGYYNYYMRNSFKRKNDFCLPFSGKLDKSGCFTEEVNSTDLKLLQNDLSKELLGEASITEEGTGIQLSTTSKVLLTNIASKLSFVDADKGYKPGIPYTGKIKMEDYISSPVPETKVYLTVRHKDRVVINQTLVTDSTGHATFRLDDTIDWEEDVFLQATRSVQTEHFHSYDAFKLQDNDGYHTISPFYSKGKNFLKVHSLQSELPCEGEQDVQVEYFIQHTLLHKETKQIMLYYLVVNKKTVKDSGTLQIPINSEADVLQGEVSLKLQLSVAVSPEFHVLSYIFLPDGELVADSARFKVLRCFQNKVSVGFSPDEVLPGSDVSLGVRAAAGSLCALRVVDQSVVLMKPEKELTAENIYNLFPSGAAAGYDHRIDDQRSYPCGFPFYIEPFFPDRMSTGFRPSRPSRLSSKSADVYSLFKEASLKIITNADIKKPQTCQPYLFPKFGAGPMGRPGLANSPTFNIQPVMPERGHVVLDNIIPDLEQKVEKQRVYFPETWIWQLTPVGTSGHVNLPVTVPDTITDWTGGAFCMGPSGFGISSPTTLRAFQPFFVELALPYSVVRGETFTLKASVFNYLKECIKVQTSLLPSLELEEEPCATCQYQSCLCADERRTFYWNLTATNLGDVNITVQTKALDTHDLCHNEVPVVPKQGHTDTVMKPLLVQSGGVLEEKSHSSLLCTQTEKDGSKSEDISLKVPDNILKDSERAHVTVLGDLMGTAMQNLERLLAMPYGCGEQNMVLFAPNIFIMQYLEKTEQLNNEIQTKATKFLKSGYQRQLTYKHDDGSYSAFGKNDPEGNTWLSAFVVKSYSKARPYIFIDETHLTQSKLWLKEKRKEDGCFRSVGRLFNNAMKGGVDDEISLSAYVTIALLESGQTMEDELVRDSVSCLMKAAPGVSSVYTQALLAYTFTLCGETELRQDIMTRLEATAVRSDGQLHWERPSSGLKSDLPFWYRAPSAEVELTSYVLLALLHGPDKDLGTASKIVNWLSKQQNPYGGFSSTQDTIVALQALAKYAESTYSDKGDIQVEVQSLSGFKKQFHVANNNRLLLQKATLPDVPGDYKVTATGSGCVYVQTVLRYNVPPPRSDATFEVRVDTDPKECPPSPATKLKIQITARYTGSRDRSNMALIEVKMLSGFIPEKSSVKELEKAERIRKSEIQTDQVTLYLDELGHTASVFSITVEQESLVKNLKPATVKVYDYYETGEYAIAEYNSPCSSDEEKVNSR